MEPKKVAEYTWEIKKQGKMKVPTIIYASDKLMEKIKLDRSLVQGTNVACLPGIQKASYTMPDAHEGYGFPIGGVAAFDLDEGIVSPGGVGYDINCGVRVLRTPFTSKQVDKKRKQLLDQLARDVPAGVGRGGITKLSKEQLFEVLTKGGKWAFDNNYGTKDDLKRTEENGCMPGANPSVCSEKAIIRGKPQLGTLGAGNHFLEIQKVEEIYDKKIAKTFGIEKENQILVMIHCGSRGFGHQVASDYIRLMEDRYGVNHLPDRELINAPINSDLGKKYFQAMACAINFAFANRQMIAHWTRDSFKKIMGSSDGMDMVYDVCHNIAKLEMHTIDGKKKKLCIHRKGATRAFGPGREEIPAVYRKVGQPVIIPGSMGTASYLLVGTKEAEMLSWSSTAHGAGRVMSRSAALKQFRGEAVKTALEQKDIEVKAGSWKGLAEEGPASYKDINEVVRVSDSLKLAKKVVKLVPYGVMKG
ncbi:RtcB family protein [Candidatus Woesearchaeota archaeon]|nr:RtcB family protein [Candidatus Woesearchaeota archaeon]